MFNNNKKNNFRDGFEGREELFDYPTHTRALPWFMGFLLGYFLSLKSGTNLIIHKVRFIK